MSSQSIRALSSTSSDPIYDAQHSAQEYFLDPYQDTLDYIDRALKGEVKGLTFGWGPKVDKATFGLEPENLIIVGGENKAGKTTHAVNTVGANLEAGKKVLVVTTEVTAKQYHLRIICRSLGLSLAAIRTGALEPLQIRALYKEVFRLRDNGLLHVADSPYCTLDHIEDLTMKYQPELVVVDHLQRLDPQNDNYALGYKILSQKLKQLAVTHEVPVMVLSQVRLQDGWFTPGDGGDFDYNLQAMSTAWTREPLGEGDKILFLHALERYIRSYKGFGTVIYHSLRDYESGGYDMIPVDYSKQRVGFEPEPTTNAPY